MQELTKPRAKTPAELRHVDPDRTNIERLASEAALKKAAADKNAEGVKNAIDVHVQSTADLVGWWETVARKDPGHRYGAGDNGSVNASEFDPCPLPPMVMQRLKRKIATKDAGGWRIDEEKAENFALELYSKYGRGLVGDAAQELGGVAISTGFYEWYTPPEYIEATREVLGTIDLDPASCEKAQNLVRAEKYFTKEDDGLAQDWFGGVFINPPYSTDLVTRFAEKLTAEYSSGAIRAGVFLVHNATDAAWWQNLASIADSVSFPGRRINFIDGRTMRQEPGSSIRGQCILYLGPEADLFNDVFGRFGLIMRRYGL